MIYKKILFLILMTISICAYSNPKKINVLVWSEQTEPKSIYPSGINHAIADFLNKQKNITATTASLSDRNLGITEKSLEKIQVLIWFGHKKHDDVPDKIVDLIDQHVKNKGLTFIALHSSHFSKPFKKLLNTSGAWNDYEEKGKNEFIKILNHNHPITRNIQDFTIPQAEQFIEPFDIPKPDDVLAEGIWPDGRRSRDVIIWHLGKGKLIYIRPGHEDYPIYFQPEMQKLIINSVYWGASNKHNQ